LPPFFMEIKIEKIVYGAKGIGKLNGKTVFVPFVLPNEIVEIKIKKEKKNFIEAVPIKIIQENPNRRDPLCKYFTICGGCDFQHIQYEYQLQIKKEILKETLQRIGKIKDIPSIEIIPSPQEFFYRNRAQFKIYKNHLGFYKKESHTIIDIDICPLLSKEIASLPKKLKTVLAHFIIQPEEIHIFSASKGALLKFIFPKEIKNYPNLKTIRKLTQLNIAGIGIYLKKNKNLLLKRTIGKKHTFQKVKDLTFRISLDSFFQINRYQIENLINTVLKHINDSQIVADMYCGVGTFSIPAGKLVKEIYGFEINKIAVKDAQENAKLNNIKNATFYPLETKKAVDFLIDNQIYVDTIIFDPPRTGLNQYIIEKTSKIASINKIVYVSCNPSTLARDLNIFQEKGFKIQHIYLIDMFPQTYHIESITFLTRKS